MVFRVIANIIARSPPAIGIALGGIGMMLSLPYAAVIFWSGVVLQMLWLGRPLLARLL